MFALIFMLFAICFTFTQPFPRQEFSEDMTKSLQELGLVPSGSLVVKKADKPAPSTEPAAAAQPDSVQHPVQESGPDQEASGMQPESGHPGPAGQGGVGSDGAGSGGFDPGDEDEVGMDIGPPIHPPPPQHPSGMPHPIQPLPFVPEVMGFGSSHNWGAGQSLGSGSDDPNVNQPDEEDIEPDPIPQPG